MLTADPESAQRVRFVGRVSDAELARLYSGASALLVASVNEGNHLGPLEALACGCEVICTDIPPLRETVGGHAHFYPVDDRRALDRLTTLALSGELPDRPRGFQVHEWPDSASLLMQSLRRALASTAPERRGAAQGPSAAALPGVPGSPGTATPLPES